MLGIKTRYPCYKIEQRWDHPGMTARAAKTGRTGWYCWVLQEGMVAPGMPITLVERPYPQWTAALVNDFGHDRNKDVETAPSLATCPLLNDFWRRFVMQRALAP